MQIKRIGVISDTHIPKVAEDLPEEVYREFASVDMILHAGDLISMSVLKILENLAPTRAVYGNMDMDDVKAFLPQKDIIQVNGFKIGLIHGYGPPGNIVNVVAREFNKVDVIVFGHTHSSFSERIKDTLFFNPGSPTDKIFASKNSFGILEIDKEITAKIIQL